MHGLAEAHGIRWCCVRGPGDFIHRAAIRSLACEQAFTLGQAQCIVRVPLQIFVVFNVAMDNPCRFLTFPLSAQVAWLIMMCCGFSHCKQAKATGSERAPFLVRLHCMHPTSKDIGFAQVQQLQEAKRALLGTCSKPKPNPTDGICGVCFARRLRR